MKQRRIIRHASRCISGPEMLLPQVGPEMLLPRVGILPTASSTVFTDLTL